MNIIVDQHQYNDIFTIKTIFVLINKKKKFFKVLIFDVNLLDFSNNYKLFYVYSNLQLLKKKNINIFIYIYLL